MGELTYKKMASLLSIKTHRERYPVVSWIEDNIRTGRANEDFGTNCREVIEEVGVKYGANVEFSYGVVDGTVVNVVTGYLSENFFEDPAAPKDEEIQLVELVHPEHFGWLRSLCLELPDYFNHPHSCALDFHIIEEECSGTGCDKKLGQVNYYGWSGGWKYYCGGSHRCCP